jgi:N-sulfoglucosamine sulfohydrolase
MRVKGCGVVGRAKLMRAIIFWVGFGLASAAQAGGPKGFVLFLADDISAGDLGCYGNEVIETPHIDRLAAGGLLFTQAYLTTSSCSPSRCSLITGRYPHNTGAPELHMPLPETQLPFPELLRQAGFHTVLSGKNHMGPRVGPAFDLISRGGGPSGSEDWVRLVRGRPEDVRFFFWFAAIDAHRPWQFGDEVRRYRADEMVVPPYLVDGERTREDLASYAHEVSRFDYYVGQVVAELEQQGVLDDTFIVVMADNGRPFPRAKSRLYDDGIKTPFVVHWPARVSPGVREGLVSSIDLAPTLLELAGVEVPAVVQGASFVAMLEDEGAVTREVAFAEQNWHVYRNHSRMVREGEWMYVANAYTDQLNLALESFQDGAGEELWERHAAGETTWEQGLLFELPAPSEELFHVGEDPYQLNNLAGKEEHNGVLRRMRGLLAGWVEETLDSVPGDPTPDRDGRPRIEGGKVVGFASGKRGEFTHREVPGEARGAEALGR